MADVDAEAEGDDFPLAGLAVACGAFMVVATLVLAGGGLAATFLLKHLADWAVPWPVAVGIGSVGEIALVAALLLAWSAAPGEA